MDDKESRKSYSRAGTSCFFDLYGMAGIIRGKIEFTQKSRR
jgi:hypothetical protein